MKNSNGTAGNRTRDLPACNAVPQPAAPPRAPYERDAVDKITGTARSKNPSCTCCSDSSKKDEIYQILCSIAYPSRLVKSHHYKNTFTLY